MSHAGSKCQAKGGPFDRGCRSTLADWVEGESPLTLELAINNKVTHDGNQPQPGSTSV